MSDTGDSRTNVYVGKIPSNWSREDLMDIFTQFGAISSLTKLPHRDYGLIKYTSNSAAVSAIRSVDGREIDCKKIVVKFADNNPLKENPIGSPVKSTNKSKSLLIRGDEKFGNDRANKRTYKEEMRLRRLEERERSPVEVVDDITFALDRKRKIETVDGASRQGSPKRSNSDGSSENDQSSLQSQPLGTQQR